MDAETIKAIRELWRDVGPVLSGVVGGWLALRLSRRDHRRARQIETARELRDAAASLLAESERHFMSVISIESASVADTKVSTSELEELGVSKHLANAAYARLLLVADEASARAAYPLITIEILDTKEEHALRVAQRTASRDVFIAAIRSRLHELDPEGGNALDALLGTT